MVEREQCDRASLLSGAIVGGNGRGDRLVERAIAIGERRGAIAV